MFTDSPDQPATPRGGPARNAEELEPSMSEFGPKYKLKGKFKVIWNIFSIFN